MTTASDVPSRSPARGVSHEGPRLRWPFFLMLAAVVISIVLILILMGQVDEPAQGLRNGP